MSTVLYWFRADLRLHDLPALEAALRQATHLVPVFCHPPADEPSGWGFDRTGGHRRAFLEDTLRDVSEALERRGSRLLQCVGRPQDVLPALAAAAGASALWCEEIAAPYEQAEVEELRSAGLTVHTVWQSSLLHPDDLPFEVADLPDVFTSFRQQVEKARVKPRAPRPAPSRLPPWPAALEASLPAGWMQGPPAVVRRPAADPRSSFPYASATCAGGEQAALAHLAQYLARKLPHSYKATRNGLTGVDYSSKWSPWLATGALSPRRAMAALRQFEALHGANDGTYWLWFELLWRDYFRLLHLQHGAALYRGRGLGGQGVPRHNARGFERWCAGRTGEPLVDAAMRELAATGYLSNRLRQVVASYLVYDLGGDWRAGAAWFEAQLVDFDVYSNQGNWLYLAGRGTDPRGGRRFNPQKQAQDHDGDGHYRRLWALRELA